jgi:uncharacterized protein YjbI with pentapeptide repeats
MANQKQLDTLLRDGVAIWNIWRNEYREILPDLTLANLEGADLREADLRMVNLTGSNLKGSNLSEALLCESLLRRAHLGQALLSGADLSKSELMSTNLRQADLREARLTGADLSWADLREAKLSGADLTRANLTHAKLAGADLSGAHFVQTDLFGADLSGCNVYGTSAWDVHLDSRTLQTDLRITSYEEEAAITVDNLEMAQFLYLMLHNEKLRHALETITSKLVLILGRFGDRKPILDALREALRRHGYVPVLFDFEPQSDKPILETVKTLANLARFVIADLTDPHMVRAELTAIIPNVPTVPVQPLIEANADLPTEYESWALFNSFRPVYRYADLSDLLANLNKSVIAPVEAHVQARRL